jgi:hypothetical protein
VIGFLSAMVAIVEADPTIEALCGRVSDVIRVWSDAGTIQDSGIAYVVVDNPVTGADNDTRLIELQLSCYSPTLLQAYQLADRLEAILTSEAFRARGVDVAPLYPRQQDHTALEDPARKLKRVDLTIVFDGINA